MFKKAVKFLLGEPEGYVSPADNFLADLREQYPHKPASQLAEITKYKEIGNLRDKPRKS